MIVYAQESQRGSTRNPHGPIDIPCQNCHTTTSWQPIRAVPEFNHDTETKYPLRGLHQSVRCTDCHRNMVFRNVGVECADCHADVHRQQFGARCQDCHSVTGWLQAVRAKQDHRNRFPLLGAHGAVQCESCHVGAATAVFTGLSTQCFACHQDDYQRVSDPEHTRNAFPLQCEECHSVDQWQNARFDHNRFTSFPLQGAHAPLDCTVCHVNGHYQGTSTDCFSCHAEDFANAKEPDHVKSGFHQDCSSCHSTISWQGATFDHSSATGFALTGAHVQQSCAACHIAGRFAGTPTECFGCHTSDFQETTNPNHSESHFPTSCETCHTTDTWLGAVFDHNLSAFPLTGAHVTTDCAQCHIDGRYAGLSTDCAGCHQADFESTQNPNHVEAGFPTSCETCHTTEMWLGAKFEHSQTGFELTGAHSSVDCAQCHVDETFTGTPTNCIGCHQEDYERATDPNHIGGGFPTSCETCHTTVQWSGAAFDHNSTTQFMLTGAHTNVTCSECHRDGHFAGTPDACIGCHLEEFNQTINPNHVEAGFPQTCEICHDTSRWQGAVFDHNRTAFALTGSHVNVDCARCHIDGTYSGTSTECVTCHLEEFNNTNDPNHAAAGFPRDCTVCHTTVQWEGATFDHSQTRFNLTGAHVSADCTQCHVNGQFAGLGTECANCHIEEFNRTTNPDHPAAGFPTACDTCHTTSRWEGASFDHSQTRFNLTGAHVSADCTQCHVNGLFAGLGTECANCHLDEFNRTTNPDHPAAGFPTACDTCHTTSRWEGANFDHSQTRFNLTGAHVSADCTQCHVNGQFSGTPQQCVGCHREDFNGTTGPDHRAADFPDTCDVCHNTSRWEGATFDHDVTTRFPLTGSHRGVDCTQCHQNGQFSGTPTNCDGCHLDDYNETTDPNHSTARFPRSCDTCHNTTRWEGAIFDHSQTRFSLTGAHVSADCAQCHEDGQFSGTPTDCAACHVEEFNRTTDPDHRAAGFPTDCSLCHSTSRWEGAQFDHSRTRFPLTGAHTQQDCLQCHAGGRYDGLSTDCDSCHIGDYNGTNDPNHADAGFPRDCSVCHSTSRWDGAVFDHSQTDFPLTGAHRTEPGCADCHVNGQYRGTPSDCYSCHRTEYNNVANPNHAAAGFPQDCAACHTTTQWTGARFDHRFPIYQGNHRQGEAWNSCTECHTNASNYGSFSCLNCHEHRQQEMDSKHREVRNYVYNSPNCLSCHPDGRE